jgi:adenylate cyclase
VFADEGGETVSINDHPHFTLRRLRLASGLVMFVYLTLHLLNHALGILSLDLAEGGLKLALAVWRNPLASFLLYGAAAVHIALALWTLYSRREWQLPWVEILRLLAGFSFPLLLIGHAVTTRLGDEVYAIHPSYAAIIANLLAQGTQGMQLALLAPGWLHGCLGLWISLRRFATMQRLKPLLVALVIIIPLAAAAGFLRMADQVRSMTPPPVTPELLAERDALAAWADDLMRFYIGAVAAALLLGRVRAFATRRSA